MKRIIIITLFYTCLIDQLLGQAYINQYEYWFDNNYSTKISIPVNSVSSLDLVTSIPTNTLQDGLHTFHIRFKDNKSLYSSVMSQRFVKLSPSLLTNKKIVAFEYWFDSNFSQRVYQSIQAQDFFQLNAPIPSFPLSIGIHNFNVRFKDDAGMWSVVLSQSTNITVVSNLPVIKSISPVTGATGTVVSIIGENFSTIPANNIVKFNGTIATITGTPTSTSITATVPSGATTGKITVAVGGQIATSIVDFSVGITTSPTITSFSPTSGAVGSSITITGTNFSTTPSNNIVKFNNVTAVVTASTATSITTSVPIGATSGTITVTVGGQTATSATSFTVNSTSPTILSFTPAIGVVGTSVTITGTNFSTTPSNNIVKFNGTVATITGTPTATSIVAVVPTGATTGNITVEVAGQIATSSSQFTVNAPSPSITSFTPSSGLVGTTVTVSGTNFSTTAANNIVKFNGTIASITGTPTTTIIVAGVPTGATTGKITVSVGGQIATSTNNFNVTAPPPAPWFGVFVDDPNHPHLARKQLLESTDFSQSNLVPILLCADGSNVTIVKYVNRNPAIPNGNIRFRVSSAVTESNVSKTGSFEYKTNIDTIIAKFTHPQFVNTSTPFRADFIEVFNSAAVNQPLHQYPIKVYRAPVVFVHGLWGDSTAFTEMKKTFSSKVPLSHSVDYRYSNNSNFFTNRYVVRFGIDDVLRKARVSKFSAGKAVVIGHSMGGILSRLYLQSTYASPQYRFDISKLITVNTPHLGSQLANLLFINKVLAHDLNVFFGSGYYRFNPDYAMEFGAITDLRVDSDPITKDLNIFLMYQNKIPSTTINTNAVVINVSNPLSQLYTVGTNLERILFDLDTHDLVVSLKSQKGGINLNETVQNQMHLKSTNNPEIKQLSLKLIDENPSNSAFFSSNGFPPDRLPPPLIGASQSSPSGRIASIDSIKIISPINGKIFSAGDSVSVDIFKGGSVSKTALFVFGSSIEPIIISLPENATKTKFKISTTALGILNLWALGGGSNNSFVQDISHIVVNSTVVPDSILSNPRKISLALGETVPMSVDGYFSGIPINLGGSQELSFSFDQLYLNKISNGIFQGKKVGSTNVLVSYKGKIFNLQIDIQSDPSKLITSFDQSANEICEGTTIQFKNKSIGLSTGYKWTFPGGSPNSSNQSDPIITYSTPGQYLVKLKTTFVNGLDSAFIDSLITVKPVPAKPTISISGATLTSSATQGNQWYLWALPIKGETNQTLNATEVGTYTVISTVNKCASQESVPMDIMITGILQTENSFVVYPNPNNGRFIIKKAGLSAEVQIEIFSIIGVKVYEAAFSTEETEIDLSHLPKGMYLIKPKTNKEYLPVMKIIVQ